ncbi:ABC transporter ATP-binding protein [Saccharopolyspora sp. TS4A08]|uniref:ABC transporter ATP-binding protein n=1 Tax=Saccharopolyspora ipomoeae TaxID=3042027 RepID=A0ABT6PLE1_9PSEU|nr:ABC transporter ATP-binding protein [Saccharopolyspora sp. TS4A08]MDI2028783.1 ABC transporter ATP-binding protein [Saccharopolyspora sp. TS4A08]
MHDGSGRIHVQGLNKTFGPVHAVQDLSFTVQPGAVTGFLGPNGAGKTTALRMILGLVAPTSGTATINGLPFHRLPKPGGIVGAVLDAHGFHPNRTARHHLRCYAAAMDVPDSQVDRALELVGLAAAADRKTGGFSLGMRQRLALATALLGDPQILVLDEPANGLDPEGIAWLRGFLHAFAAGGRTVLMSSHFLREIENTVDRLVIISQGRCVYDGHVEELRAAQQARALVQADSPEVLVGKVQEAGFGVEYLPDGRLAVIGADSRAVADLAREAGVALYAMQDERIDLEQLFFRLTHGQYAGLPQYAPPRTWTGRPGEGGDV